MSLLSGFKKGDKKALEHIYLRYYKRVYLLSLHFTEVLRKQKIWFMTFFYGCTGAGINSRTKCPWKHRW